MYVYLFPCNFLAAHYILTNEMSLTEVTFIMADMTTKFVQMFRVWFQLKEDLIYRFPKCIFYIQNV